MYGIGRGRFMRGRGNGRLKTAQELENDVTEMAHILDRDEVSDSDIDRGFELIEQVHTYLEEIDLDERSNCVAVLGTTGVGKSTVVHLLFGEGLLVHHENAYSRVLVATKPLPGVNIHSGSSSKTLIPGVIKTNIDEQPCVIFDMPGSRDTRGPFAELVVHSILKWMLTKHEQMHFLLVATPPQERPQAVALADMINRLYDGCSNTILVYTKCDVDFEPESTIELEGIAADKQNIPSFGLNKPAKSHKEGQDYPATKTDIQWAIRSKLNFRKRTIGKAREMLSNVFLETYDYDNFHRSFDIILELLDALMSQQALSFMAVVSLLEQLLPCCIRTVRTVEQAHKRLIMVERWCGGTILLCKEEWLTEECRGVLKTAENNLSTMMERVCAYRHVQRSSHAKTLVISAWRLQLSEEDLLGIKDFVKLGHTNTAEGIPTVVLVGFTNLSLDNPIRMWANLIVVSPSVHISSTVELSAVGHAPAHVPSRAGPGQDGAHGVPGLYGGSFVLICRELGNDDTMYFKDNLLKSTGQDGGVGQNAGKGINGDDAVYDASRFNASAKRLVTGLPTVKDLKLILNKLPRGMELEKSSMKEIPPNNSDIAIAAVSAAVASAAIMLIPEVGAGVGAVGLAVGGGIIKHVFERNTKTKLELTRPSFPGTRGTPPGCRGQGGYGGYGGDFYVIQSGQELLAWSGASGHIGGPGRAGQPSYDGKNSSSIKGKVRQEYDPSGKRFGAPRITTTEEAASTPRELVQEAFTPGEPLSPTKNPLLFIDATEYYDEAFARFVEAFPRCDFADLVMP